MISVRHQNKQPLQDKDQQLPKVRVGGRFLTAYDPEKALEILERLADGETLNEICKGKPGMPHPTTFKRWAINQPELAKAYINAIQLSATSLEEEALDTARLIALKPKDGTHVRAVEVKLNQLRWSAERRDPAKFGTKSQINVRVPVQIITSLDLGDESGGPASADIYNISATVPRTIEGSAALVPEAQIIRSLPPITTGPRKKVLIPRVKSNLSNPFSLQARGIDVAEEPIRPEGNQPSHTESSGRQGDSEPDSGQTEVGPIDQSVLNHARSEESK